MERKLKKQRKTKISLRMYVVKHYLKRQLLFVLIFILIFVSFSTYFVNSIKKSVLRSLPTRVLNTFSIINQKAQLLTKAHEDDFLYALYRIENAFYTNQDVTSILDSVHRDRFGNEFLRLDYYLIDKNGIIYKTSYLPELNSNLGELKDFWNGLKENLKEKGHYFQIYATEPSTGLRRIYVYKYTQNEDILRVGALINPSIYEEDLAALNRLSIFLEQVSILFNDKPISTVFDAPPKNRVSGYQKLYKSEHWFEEKVYDEVIEIYVRTNFYKLFIIVEMAVVLSIVLFVSTLMYLRSLTNSISNEVEKIENAISEYGNTGIFSGEFSSSIIEIEDTLKTFSNLSEVINANIEEITAANEELEASYQEIQMLHKEIQEAFFDFSMKLAYVVEGFEEGTGKHLTRVRFIVEKIAEKIVEDAKLREEIVSYSILHDIGKIFIPKEILNKPGALSPAEWEEMKKHTIYAQKILSHPRFQTALNIAVYHHENYDGTGYPYGLKGEEIPIEARIVKIADVYDALTSERPYKRAFSKQEALRIIFEGDGRVNPQHFDPNVLEVFKTIVDQL
ncbi:MAG: HD-GYP domain-containing protein [Fervidobacterium sp.]|nr:HD-GYP domain-containing protein [Fervidobacterium sp.]